MNIPDTLAKQLLRRIEIVVSACRADYRDTAAVNALRLLRKDCKTLRKKLADSPESK